MNIEDFEKTILSLDLSDEQLIPILNKIGFDKEEWDQHFSDHPDSLQLGWYLLDGGDWRFLLEHQPQFADKCDWLLLSGENWCDLLSIQLQFAEHCDWSKLEGDDWCYLLRYQPQFAEHCNWYLLDDSDWGFLLDDRPLLAKYKPK